MEARKNQFPFHGKSSFNARHNHKGSDLEINVCRPIKARRKTIKAVPQMENIWLMIASKCKFAERFGRKTNRFEIRGSVFESGSNELRQKAFQKINNGAQQQANWCQSADISISPVRMDSASPRSCAKCFFVFLLHFPSSPKPSISLLLLYKKSLTFETINLLAGEIYKFSMEATDGF